MQVYGHTFKSAFAGAPARQEYSKTFENHYIETCKNCIETFEKSIETFNNIQRLRMVRWLIGELGCVKVGNFIEKLDADCQN